MLKLRPSILLLVCFLLVLNNCGDSSVSSSSDDGIEEKEIEEKYSSDYEHNLNVVYFSTVDQPPHNNFEERISGTMLYLQDYYKKWMQEWGYGEKTFGLRVNEDHTKVDIIHIEGEYKSSHYPYEGGANEVMDEINAYFDEHPDRKTSDHILVLMPDNKNAPEPYYGIGRWCFALDSGPQMDVDNLGVDGEAGEQAGWIGGLAHELGHGLNLPHNSHKVNENKEFGTALMDNGNHVFDDKTYLTPVDAAILNTNQVFNKSGSSYYGDAEASITEISAQFENNAIVVEGVFESNTSVSDVIIYQDPEGRSTYNQIGWTLTPGSNEFSIEMSADELFETSNKRYKLKVRLVFGNGTTRLFNIADYQYQDGTADIAIDYGPRDIYDRANWLVRDVSSEEVGTGSVAANILDGDYDTIWHSRWSDVNPDPGHPHHLTVDMGEQLTVKGFQFVQRQDGRRNIKGMTIEVSTDGQSWQELGTYELAHISTAQSLPLESVKEFRYFKVTTHSAWDGEEFAALAEVGVY